MRSGLLAEDGLFQTLHTPLERLRDTKLAHGLDERIRHRVLAPLNGLNGNGDLVEPLFDLGSELAKVVCNCVDASRILIELSLDHVEALVVFVEAPVVFVEPLVVRVEALVVFLGLLLQRVEALVVVLRLLLEVEKPLGIRLVHLPGPHQE
ncbi:MAG: hypothetical protein GQE15_03375 [Archangiaceae bacterium]|nr:hypothetical protein [Archangiaceae bacterium]